MPQQKKYKVGVFWLKGLAPSFKTFSTNQTQERRILVSTVKADDGFFVFKCICLFPKKHGNDDDDDDNNTDDDDDNSDDKDDDNNGDDVDVDKVMQTMALSMSTMMTSQNYKSYVMPLLPDTHLAPAWASEQLSQLNRR